MIIIALIHPDFEEMPPEQQQAEYERVQLIVRKCAHFTEFMMLGFTARLCLESWFGRRVRYPRVLQFSAIGMGIMYACTDEMHQRKTEGRSGAWTDVLIDGGGVFAGALLALLFIRKTEKAMKNGRN